METVFNCRNCEMRFGCKDSENNNYCENHVFDEEAATCDDCSKKTFCNNFVTGNPTCVDWEPDVFCDDCSLQETCKNYTQNGRICEKFKEIRYTLTERGAFYISLLIASEEYHCIDVEELDKSFFDELDHEMKLNGLVKDENESKIKKVFEKIRKKIKKKDQKTFKDIFFEMAKSKKYFGLFGNCDDAVEKVYGIFLETLIKIYEKK